MLAVGSKGRKLLEVLGPTHLHLDVRTVDISLSCKVSPVARWANELHLGVVWKMSEMSHDLLGGG